MAYAPPPIDPFGPGVHSFNRLDVVMKNAYLMPPADWFRQLGDAWSMCDNISAWRSILRAELNAATRAELDLMMSADERAALAALPERIEVWRGCYAVNRPGLSWTTKRDVAERIVTLNRYRRSGDQPLIRRGTTRRDRAVLKLDRDEWEVIAPRVFGITEQRFLLPTESKRA